MSTPSGVSDPVQCALTGKKFKIQRAELDFHRRMNVALPRIAPLERIRHNAEFLVIRPLHSASCNQCGDPIRTVRDDSQQKILCEDCFQRSVY